MRYEFNSWRHSRGRSYVLTVALMSILGGVIWSLSTFFSSLRMEATLEEQKSRVGTSSWSESYLNYTYLRKAWEVSGRDWLHTYSGVQWRQAPGKWEMDAQWPDRATQVGAQAYYVEYSAQGALNMALLCHDTKLLNELAEFYLVYGQHFTTLGAMRRRKSPSLSTALLDNQGDDSAKTLIWIDQQPDGARIRECVLCNAQFLHPASKLIRAITLLPASERTASMKNFVSFYAPLIVQDHLLRLLYVAEWDYWGAKELPKHLVEIWKAITAGSVRTKSSYQQTMQDWDLWLIATAAEILGANAKDPNLVPLRPNEKERLQQAVQLGVGLFQKKRTIYPDTKNFRGAVVGSASYFNGDFDDHEDMAYSGYTGKSFPAPKDKRTHPGASWDVSHFSRVPVFLRSLYDNKNATGMDFPSARDLELVINQLMYRVFQGDFRRPLFNNFFDGSNGWYRVNYSGTKTGYPPAQYCDAHSEDRFCLTPGEVQGWGLLAQFHPDLKELQHSLLKLAWSDDPQTRSFKDQYYLYKGWETYSFRDSDNQLQYPVLLFWVLSDVAEDLQGCSSH